MRLEILPLLLCSVVSMRGGAQSASQDRPVSAMSNAGWDSLTRAMQPAIARARATYPAARERYVAGLRPGYRFYVTTTLFDSVGHKEQVFISVDSIRKERIFGRIASEIGVVEGFHANQPYMLPEPTLIDWLITDPNGAEEGNFVGKFMDAYQDSLRAKSVGTVTFRFASDSGFAVIGDFAGTVDVRADSLVVTIDSMITTANRANLVPVRDVSVRAALGYRSSQAGDWAIAAMSDSVVISTLLEPGKQLPGSRVRFALARPKYQLAAFWLVFRYEAAYASTQHGVKEFTTYAQSDQSIFRRFM